MDINGVQIDDDAEHEQIKFPKMIKGRIAHIDGDLLAYIHAAEGKDKEKQWADMMYSAELAIATITKQAGAEKYVLHFTAPNSNHGGRDDIAILKPYKGNRKDKVPPRMLHELRLYLIASFKSIVHDDCEADDGMSAAQYTAIKKKQERLSIICTLDKDLNMVPGYHLNWTNGKIIQVKGFGEIWLDDSKSQRKLKGYGTKFFWAQMLMGDPADNISGIPEAWDGKKFVKVGVTKAFHTIDPCKDDADAKQLVKYLYEQYQACGKEFYHWAEESPDGINICDPITVFESEAKLLWMRRKKNDPNDVLKWIKGIK